MAELPVCVSTVCRAKLLRKDFADFCFKTYGDRVKQWTTFNEPRYCRQFWDRALHHLILAHGAAAQRYREEYQVRSIVFFTRFDEWDLVSTFKPSEHVKSLITTTNACIFQQKQKRRIGIL
ncbi:hypothetical protein GQ457_01G024880 [Hibiscus cannabinus]